MRPHLPLRNVLLVQLGSFILAAGISNIHAIADVTEGGIVGLTLLLHHWFGISPALSSLILDGSCYLIGWKLLGRNFLLYSLISCGGYSFFYALLEPFSPVFPALAEMPFLAAVLGALFVGVGCGITVLAGGAASGDDALAMVLCRRLKTGIQNVYLFSDFSVLLLSLTYIPLRKIAFSLLTVLLSGQIIGWIQKIPVSVKTADNSIP